MRHRPAGHWPIRWLWGTLLLLCVAGLRSASAQEDVPSSGGLFGAIRKAISQGSRPAGRPLTPPGAPLLCTRDALQIYTTNAYGDEGVRYFAIQLRFKNNSAEPVTVFSKRSRLTIGTEEFLRVQTREELQSRPITINDETHDVELLQGGPEQVVPPNSLTWVWLVFAKIPPDRELPETTLKVETSAGPIEVNLTRFEADALTLRTERIGPRQCIGITYLSGELNSLNASKLMAQLTTAAEQGASRAVIVFDKGARLGDPLLSNWLVYGREIDSDRYDNLPLWSGQIKDVALVKVPGMGDETEENLASNEDDGVLLVSRRLVTQLDSATLRQELAHGHPMVRRAVLLGAGELLANDDPLLIVPFLTSIDQESRLAAIRSLKSATDAAVVPPLEEIVQNGPQGEAFEALAALNSSSIPAARARAIHLVQEVGIQKKLGLLRILTQLPIEAQPQWYPWLRTLLNDKTAAVRNRALRLLLVSGVEDRRALLEKALQDPQESVRDMALEALLVYRTEDEQALFREETLRRVKRGVLDDRMRIALRELADPATLPSILAAIEKNPQREDGIVELYLEIGGTSVGPQIEGLYSQLSSDTRSHVLRQWKQWGNPKWIEMATQGLAQSDDSHAELCRNLLVEETHPYILPALVKAWKAATDDNAQEISRAIGAIGTEAAKQTLEKMLESAPLSRRPGVKVGLFAWNSVQPVRDILLEAYRLNQADQWQAAADVFTFAMELDPENPLVFSGRGHARLRLAQFDEAEVDFRRAMELDPDGHTSLSGLAICKAIRGQYTDAIQMVHTPLMLDRFGKEQIYLYNVACVYGRSIEHVLKEPASPERDARLAQFQQQAIRFLNSSLQNGFDDGHLLATDPDLSSLRELPAFQKLREKIPDLPQ